MPCWARYPASPSTHTHTHTHTLFPCARTRAHTGARARGREEIVGTYIRRRQAAGHPSILTVSPHCLPSPPSLPALAMQCGLERGLTYLCFNGGLTSWHGGQQPPPTLLRRRHCCCCSCCCGLRGSEPVPGDVPLPLSLPQPCLSLACRQQTAACLCEGPWRRRKMAPWTGP